MSSESTAMKEEESTTPVLEVEAPKSAPQEDQDQDQNQHEDQGWEKVGANCAPTNATEILSPSKWKPNANATEWKPSGGAVESSPVEGVETQGEAAAGGDSDSDSEDKKPEPETKGTAEEKDEEGKEEGKEGEKKGGEEGVKGEGRNAGEGGEEETNNGSSKELLSTRVAEVRRYAIADLLKMRPVPQDTPRPEQLQPPPEVHILWDGKELPAAPKASPLQRGMARPVPPLGGRQGVDRGGDLRRGGGR